MLIRSKQYISRPLNVRICPEIIFTRWMWHKALLSFVCSYKGENEITYSRLAENVILPRDFGRAIIGIYVQWAKEDSFRLWVHSKHVCMSKDVHTKTHTEANSNSYTFKHEDMQLNNTTYKSICLYLYISFTPFCCLPTLSLSLSLSLSLVLPYTPT